MNIFIIAFIKVKYDISYVKLMLTAIFWYNNNGVKVK